MKNDADDVFLTEDQVDYLTGISRGCTESGQPRTKYSLQVDFLRAAGIPFIANARGKPIIARAAVEGSPAKAVEAPRKRWQPKVVGE
ncbi:DUF4224 domain-containing protein [Herbaspirillum chlorophenolicum]|uniref:DUF4224 domain-containing protein n=1 Tax=Herbaspirillum chlorophenolicum TaxID=211589 RepID=A0ABW8F166_9BURK